MPACGKHTNKHCIGVGIGVAVLMVTAIVLSGTVIFLFHKQSSNKDPK